jgi:hypothetical protein
MYLQITLGEDHGSGHFYLAKTRTFLLCVDMRKRVERVGKHILCNDVCEALEL